MHPPKLFTRMSIRLSSLQALLFESQINGLDILNKTVNDFSLWRLIEYPRVTHILEAKPGDLVLDIGSGTSSYPLMLAKKGARVIAVDLEAVRAGWQRTRARTLRLPVLPVVADATALPFASNSFSRITSISAIEHIPDDRAVGQEVARVLQPGGIAAFSVPYTFNERHHFFQGLKPFQRVAKNEFVQAGRGNLVRFYTDGDLEARFAQPMQSRIEAKSFFGRALLNDRYHETRLNRYWTRLILKDLVLKWFVHPFEEIFLRNSEPFDVIFRLRKS
jgi:ubiquinone/menaquinone biosynthesis C-methylase UbiE